MPILLLVLATGADILTIAWPAVLSMLLTIGLLFNLYLLRVREANMPRGARRRLLRGTRHSRLSIVSNGRLRGL